MQQSVHEPVPSSAARAAAAAPLEEPPRASTASTRWNLATAVQRQSQLRPQALAVWAQGQALNYLTLARQAAGLAAQLQRSPDWPQRSDKDHHAAHDAPDAPLRVGILGSRSAEAIVGVLGAVWAGATYVPLGLKLPPERLLHILQRCQLSALVVDPQGVHLLSDAVLQAAPAGVYVLGVHAPDLSALSPWLAQRVTWLPASTLLGTAASDEPAAMRPDDAAYILFTSGTTGVPKGVVVPTSAVRHYTQTMTALLALTPDDRTLETFELSFDVSVHNMFCTWEAGASLHILPAARVMNAVGFAREQALTVWNSVPSLVGMLRQVKALGPGALPRLRISSFGGEPLTRSVVQAWQEAAPASTLYNFYGPTEATIGCAAQRVEEPLPLYPGRDMVAIGQAMPGNELAVVDEDGQTLPDGCPGELAIAGLQLATGYLDAPELTAARFVQRQGKRWYLTGDQAVRDASGRFHCLGRLDNQVKVLGHRVELEEVDAHVRALLQNEALEALEALVCTVAWPVVDGAAHGLVSFVGTEHLDSDALLPALKARLPAYMVPARLVALAQLPVNHNGKLDRQALRQRLDAGVH